MEKTISWLYIKNHSKISCYDTVLEYVLYLTSLETSFQVSTTVVIDSTSYDGTMRFIQQADLQIDLL
jgi:hypothetical protein